MNDYSQGFLFGFPLGGMVVGVFAMWCSMRAHKETMRMLQVHEDWLRKQLEDQQSEGEEWKR